MSPIEPFPILSQNTYIKRDDLIGGLFNGSKQRKIEGLLQAILKKKPKQVILKGSLHSNFLVAILPKLIQHKIDFLIYLNKTRSAPMKGNAFFLNWMISPNHFCHDLNSIDPMSWVIEEGGEHLEGQISLMSLPEEILKQEKPEPFEHIWVDLGTGSTAFALAYGLSKNKARTSLHFVSMKDSESTVREKLNRFFFSLNHHFKEQVVLTTPICFYRPTTARSFGSTNRLIFQTIREVASQTGIFLDPIYGAKLFLTAKEHPCEGKTLFIHSGGTLSLSGFEPLN